MSATSEAIFALGDKLTAAISGPGQAGWNPLATAMRDGLHEIAQATREGFHEVALAVEGNHGQPIETALAQELAHTQADDPR